jgi:hypothetical protein
MAVVAAVFVGTGFMMMKQARGRRCQGQKDEAGSQEAAAIENSGHSAVPAL